MGSETTLSKTAQQVLEFLLTQPATIDEVSKHLERHPRTVYRSIREIEDLEGYTVVRTGPQTAYTFSVMAAESVDA